jgi:hypothetical protein
MVAGDCSNRLIGAFGFKRPITFPSHNPRVATPVAWNLFHAEATRVIRNGDRSTLPRRPHGPLRPSPHVDPERGHRDSPGVERSDTPGRPPPTPPGTPKVVRERATDGFRVGGEPTQWATTVERRALPSATVILQSTPSGSSHGGSPSHLAGCWPGPCLFSCGCPAVTGWETRHTTGHKGPRGRGC